MRNLERRPPFPRNFGFRISVHPQFIDSKVKSEKLRCSLREMCGRLAPDSEQSAERSASSLSMWMHRIRAAKIYDFAVTVNCSLLVFAAMMSEVTLHQPGFRMMWIHLQDSVNKYLGNFPTFL